MEPQSVKAILDNVLKRAELSDRIEEYRALLMWSDITPKLAARTKAVGINNGRMVVNVSDSVILHHLTFYKKKYMDKINLLMGKRIVKEIIFRVNRIENRENKSESGEEYIRKLHDTELDQDQLDKIDEIVAQVEDEELRDSLKEIFVSQSKLSRVREADE